MKTQPLDLDADTVPGRALFSPDGRYRYTLERSWAALPRYVLWIMLNPSTADAQKSDATVRRCLGFAKDWGYTGILVGNLYAFRSTSPRQLYTHAPTQDVVGPENDQHLRGLIRRASLIVCAWGNRGPDVNRRWDVLRLIADQNLESHCLRLNSGSDLIGLTQREPAHPLRLPRTLKPQRWYELDDRGPGHGA